MLVGLSRLDEMRRAGLRENRRRMHYTMITAFGGTPLEAVGIFLKEALADRQRRRSWLDFFRKIRIVRGTGGSRDHATKEVLHNVS